VEHKLTSSTEEPVENANGDDTTRVFRSKHANAGDSTGVCKGDHDVERSPNVTDKVGQNTTNLGVERNNSEINKKYDVR
jgi:hypothetical protein